jgi:cytochrome c oxidase subunit 1
VEAAPGIRWRMPEPSIWPLLSALAVTVLFIWSVFSPWGVVWGAIPVAMALTAWFWPRKGKGP